MPEWHARRWERQVREARRWLVVRARRRRAQRYRPRDPYLGANIDSALRDAGQPVEQERSFLELLLFWQDWTSYPEKLLALAIAATLTCLVGLAALLRRGLRRARWALLAVTLLLAVSAAIEIHDVEVTKHGVVIAKETVARKGNAESYAPAFTDPLREGAEFTVLERRAGWLRIRLERGDGLDGWIPASAATTY